MAEIGACAPAINRCGECGGLAPLSILGRGTDEPLEMTPELVRGWLQNRLDRPGNPRLKLGDLGTAADGTITAEIRTTDGVLVQKLAFNRFPGRLIGVVFAAVYARWCVPRMSEGAARSLARQSRLRCLTGRSGRFATDAGPARPSPTARDRVWYIASKGLKGQDDGIHPGDLPGVHDPVPMRRLK